MSKKSIWIIVIIIIVVIGAGVGVYALSHKSTAPTAKTSSKTASSSSSTTAGTIVQTKTSSSVGQYLADENGNPLYTYGGDTTGVSNCNGTCLIGWPVYTPSSASAKLLANVTIITRSDNTLQYAYKGLPLYTFSGDVNGNVNGNGVSDFSVAKP